MAFKLLSSLMKFYHFVFTELSDPRTNHWFLIGDPIPGLTLIALYLFFSTKWGPKIMENRKPFKLQKTLIVYNFIQVLVSCYIVYEGLDAVWLREYSWKCQPVDFSRTPEAMRVARGCFVYFMAKLSELLDTVFFVMRKKNKQITFLHLYHHSVMPMISWGATKYYPGGHGTLIGVINSFVHIIMYSYYLFAAFGPRFQKYLFWKKYITTLQMVQFGITFLHSAQLMIYDCGYPRSALLFTLPNALFFFYLFADFYNNAYTTENEVAKQTCKNKSDDCVEFRNGQAKPLSNGQTKVSFDDDELRNGLVKANSDDYGLGNGNIKPCLEDNTNTGDKKYF